MSVSKEAPKPVKKTPLPDIIRQRLAARLDAELQNFIGDLEVRRYEEKWPEDRWEQEMLKHPYFMLKLSSEREDMSPLMQGTQLVKFNEATKTPKEMAIAYKGDGNFNFHCKHYCFAILSYSEGLRKKCGDPEVESQLFNNRAAAQFALKNWRSCIEDCKATLKWKPGYPMVQNRLAECLYKVGNWNECLECLEEILKNNEGDKEALEMQARVLLHKKVEARDKRKQRVSRRKTAESQQRTRD